MSGKARLGLRAYLGSGLGGPLTTSLRKSLASSFVKWEWLYLLDHFLKSAVGGQNDSKPTLLEVLYID